MKDTGFTLVEVMVVISIIGALSSVVISSLASTRVKGYDAAAWAAGTNFNTFIANCDFDGGKVTVPNSSTNPTNDMCTLGANYGKWPPPPVRWTWEQQAWIDGENNFVRMLPTYGNGRYNQILCGHYIAFAAYCPQPAYAGLCRLAKGFSCTPFDQNALMWR